MIDEGVALSVTASHVMGVVIAEGITVIDKDLHHRMLCWTHDLIMNLNRYKVEEGELTEEELQTHTDEQMMHVEALSFDSLTRKLLEEIPPEYFGTA